MTNATMGSRAVAADRPDELAPAAAALPLRAGSIPGARPHVCFVALYAWPMLSGDPQIAEAGGAEVQQVIRVSMICLDYGQADLSVIDGVSVRKAYRLEAGVPVLRFLHPRLSNLWRRLGEVDADIYYCRAAGMLPGVVAEFCRGRGKRSIYAGASDMDFAADLSGKIRYARDRWLYRRGLSRVDAIVAQNEAQRASCRANHGREARVIPSCFKPAPSPQAAQAPRDCVLWIGMTLPGKRPQLFLELARRLPHRRFVLIGGPGRSGGAVFARLREEAAGLANVELTGFLPLPEVERRLDSARVLVNTSDYEGMPNTFLQAWARGVPTLGTVDVGVPVHVQFADLDQGARQIEALFTSTPEWERASKDCREHFERSHSGAETLRRYARLFEELMA
jgi:glycosyltransferase involved in cell wall biosynthesis